jgi:hypothetical protein
MILSFKKIFSIIIVGIFLFLGYKYFINRDNFNFSVTPAKRCDGGSYMTQSGPSHKMCNELLSSESGRDEYSMFNCSGKYNGRPLNFGELTSLSNDDWKNTSCDNNTVDSSPNFGFQSSWTPIPL